MLILYAFGLCVCVPVVYLWEIIRMNNQKVSINFKRIKISYIVVLICGSVGALILFLATTKATSMFFLHGKNETAAAITTNIMLTFSSVFRASE